MRVCFTDSLISNSLLYLTFPYHHHHQHPLVDMIICGLTPGCEEVTEDYTAYVGPGISCLANSGIPDAVFSCFGCLQSFTDQFTCQEWSDAICGEESIVTGACGPVCGECAEGVESALLCVLGNEEENCIMSGLRHGYDDSIDYQCPP